MTKDLNNKTSRSQARSASATVSRSSSSGANPQNYEAPWPPRIGIVVARFNEIVTSKLLDGAVKCLERRGITAENLIIWEVPGSFELPLAAQRLLDDKALNCHGVVALGAVLRGTTDHYDYVCSAVTSGLMQVQLKTSRPVGFGVLTCDTMEQAFDRAGGKLGNKGAECADTVLEMVALK